MLLSMLIRMLRTTETAPLFAVVCPQLVPDVVDHRPDSPMQTANPLAMGLPLNPRFLRSALSDVAAPLGQH
jgi:hypothetical protein